MSERPGDSVFRMRVPPPLAAGGPALAPGGSKPTTKALPLERSNGAASAG